MINVDRAPTETGAVSRVLPQVDEELVLEIAPGERDAVEQIVRDKMGSAEMDVRLDVSVGVVHSWHDAAH